jgi:predicted alpha/beta hydrolase
MVRPLPVATADGAASTLLLLSPSGSPQRLLYWLPALGVPARHYLPLAEALAATGVAVALHEWRGIGSSNRRAGRRQDWGYRELLLDDLPAGLAAARAAVPMLGTCWLGGHSLGGQLAALYAGLRPAEAAGLLLVASGSPYWRRFRLRWPIRAAFALAPRLAQCCGYLPGRRIGFGGNEARGVIRDWAASGASGRYAAAGIGDLEPGLAGLDCPLLALRLEDDWLGPAASLEWLLAKMPRTRSEVGVMTAGELQGPADHFGWMKTPGAVAARMADWFSRQDTVSATAAP